MRYIFRIFTIAFLFYSFSALQAGIIRGKITDGSTEEPLVGAMVSATNETLAITFETESDVNGLFELDLPNGYYKLKIELDGYIPSTGFSFFIQEGTVFEDLTFELRKAFILDNLYSGIVLNTQTQLPIAGAFVYLYSDEHTVGTTTDEEGRFEVTHIQPAKYRLGIAAIDYEGVLLEEVIEIEDSTKIEDVELTLNPQPGYSVTLSGEVYVESAAGKEVIANAPIHILAYSFVTGDSLYYETVTDEEGKFSIPGIQPAVYNAHAVVEGYIGDPKFGIPLFVDTEVEFELHKIEPRTYSYISGRVRIKNSGEPLRNVKIKFYNDDEVAAETYTDYGGFYSKELEPGEYKISATLYADSLFGYNFPDQTIFYDSVDTIDEAEVVELEENETVTDINFTFDRPNPFVQVTVEGKIKDENDDPVEDAAVYIHKYSTPYLANPIIDRVFSDEEGNYSISFVAFDYEQNFAVQVSKLGYESQFYGGGTSINNADFFTLRGDTLYFKDSFTIIENNLVTGIDFTLEEGVGSYGSIEGRITDENGLGINHAYIVANNIITEVPYSVVTDSSGSDSGGYFRLTNLPNGEYVILIYADGYEPEFYDDAQYFGEADVIDINGNGVEINAELQQLQQSPGSGLVHGRIYANNNRILSGSLVRLYNSEGKLIDFSISNVNGMYVLNHVHFNYLTITVSKPGYQEIQANANYQPSENNSMEMNFSMQQVILSVDDNSTDQPVSYSLGNNYPNPFNPSTTINFAIPDAGLVKLKVYNILGQEIRSLINNRMPAGNHKAIWNGKDNSGNAVATGLYLYSIEAGSFRNVKKMVLLK